MELLRKEYNDQYRQTVHLSFANFREYCDTFQQVRGTRGARAAGGEA